MNAGILILALTVGIATGLRTMAGVAVISWAAYLNWINLHDSRLAFLGSLPAVIVLTAGVFGQLIADKLPRIGRRTAAGPLIARMIAGGVCGVAICIAANQSFELGAALGAGGAIVGSVAGYYLRTSLVRRIGTADMFIAVPEDLLAIGLSILAVLSL